MPIFIISENGGIASYAAFKDSYEGACYPDTSIRNMDKARLVHSQYYPMKPYGQKDRLGRGSGVCNLGALPFCMYKEVVFNSLPADTLSIYIFSKDTLDRYDWAVIQSEYKVLQRYDISYDDFVRFHGQFYYPPTPGMKNIHMWPRYTALTD